MRLIEFAGSPGTGKTALISTLSRSDDYMDLDEAYKYSIIKALTMEYPIFSHKLSSLLVKLTPLTFRRYVLSRITGLNGRMIIRYCSKYPNGLSVFETFAKRYTDDRERQVSALNMMLPTIDKYMVIEEFWKKKGPLLVDEGFVQKGGSIFSPPKPSKPISEDDVKDYSKSIPLPDLLIIMKSDPEVCESRLRKKRGGYHSEYNKLDRKSMIDRIRRYDRFFEIISKELESEGVKVVEIDSQGDIRQMEEKAAKVIKKTLTNRNDRGVSE